MSKLNVVTSQPLPTAPPAENINLVKPSEKVILMQPLFNNENMNGVVSEVDGFKSSAPADVLTQPMLNNEGIEMLTRAEADEEKERRRQRNSDFCCYACVDSYTTDNDVFCWYLFCRMLCGGCGHCCECCANCVDSCCEGCAECCNNCCDDGGCCGGDGGCCDGDGGCCDGDGGCCDGDGGCCDGDAGNCDCDCDCSF